MQRAAESLAADADAAADASPPADGNADPAAAPSAEALAAADRARAAAQALAEAAAVAQRQGLTPELEDSAEAVAENQLAQAGSGQQNALDTLDAMLDQLGEEESLRQAILQRRRLELIDRLRRLVADQTTELDTLDVAAAANAALAPLAEAQSRLWVRTVAAETLARATTDDAAAPAAGDAPGGADIAGHLVAASDAQTAAQPALTRGSAADARAAETSALAALERALAAAQEAQDDAAQDATRDERAALRKAYEELADRQDELRERVAAAVPAPGEALPRRARATLRGLAAEETTLRTDAAELSGQIEDTLVFKQTHARIDTAAATAADTLRAARPGPTPRPAPRPAWPRCCGPWPPRSKTRKKPRTSPRPTAAVAKAAVAAPGSRRLWCRRWPSCCCCAACNRRSTMKRAACTPTRRPMPMRPPASPNWAPNSAGWRNSRGNSSSRWRPRRPPPRRAIPCLRPTRGPPHDSPFLS